MEGCRTKGTKIPEKSCPNKCRERKKQENTTTTSEDSKSQEKIRNGERGGGGGGRVSPKPAEKKKSQTVLNIVYLNARSIVSKLDDLELLANEKKPALILICESWCNSNINNAFLSIDNYYLEPNLRYDRCDTQFGIGGGLLV